MTTRRYYFEYTDEQSRVRGERKDRFDQGVRRIEKLMGRLSGRSVAREIERAGTEAEMTKLEFRKAVVRGFGKALDVATEERSLSKESEVWLHNLLLELEFTEKNQEELDAHGAYTKFIQAVILRELSEGRVPERVNLEIIGMLPFNFQKSEKLIWVFNDVEYFEQKKRVQYSGGSAGASLRVFSGAYMHLGRSKGEPVENVESVGMGKGIVAVTTKHLYFSGTQKVFRLRYDKIVAMHPHEDGVTVQRDGANARPQSFVTGDGWFLYNLLINVAKL